MAIRTNVKERRKSKQDANDRTTEADCQGNVDRLLAKVVYSSSLEAVVSLLSEGANANGYSNSTCNLQVDVAFSSQQIVRTLIDYGAHVDRQNAEGDAPLHYATYRGSSEMVCLLLNAGANSHIRNARGHTPLWTAAALNSGRTFAKLLKETELMEAKRVISSQVKYEDLRQYKHSRALCKEAKRQRDGLEVEGKRTRIRQN